MPKTMPGTLLPWNDRAGENAFLLLETTFSVSGGGLSLSQLTGLTGLSTTAIQNWVKRGWVSHPIDKKYEGEQVARILLLNLLRPALQLESIAALLNEIAEQEAALSEIMLYNMLCAGFRRIEMTGTAERSAMERLASNLLIQYGIASTESIRRSLTAMLLAMAAAQMIREAEMFL